MFSSAPRWFRNVTAALLCIKMPQTATELEPHFAKSTLQSHSHE